MLGKVKCGDYKELIKNMFIFAIGLLGSKFVQFIFLPYFTNVLSTGEYGTIDLVATFVGLIVPIVTLELSDSVLRFGLSIEIDKESLMKNMLLILFVGSIFTLILSPFLFFYKTIWSYRWYVVFLIIVQSIRTNVALFVKATNKVTIYSIDSVLTAGIIAGFDIIFISVLKKGILGYFVAEIIGSIFSIVFLFTIGGLIKYLNVRKTINVDLLKQMIKYSFPLMFNAISWWITSFSDRTVLNMFFSTSEVGIYSVAAKIPAIITTLLSVFTQAWIISAVKEYEKKKNPIFFEKVYKTYTNVLFLIVSIVIIFIKPIMHIYVGKEFFEAWYYVPILLIGTAFLGISNYYGAIYAAAKANLLEIKSTIICAVSNIVLNFILIPKQGILGAVIATVTSYIIVVIVRIIDIRKIIKIKTWTVDLMIDSILLLVVVILTMAENTVAMLVSFIAFILWKIGRFRYESISM